MYGRFLFLLIITFLPSAVVWAQQSSPASENSEIAILKKKAFKVIKETNGKVIIGAAGLTLGQKIMFVRPVPELDEFEIISHGAVKVSNEKLSLVELNTEKLAKFPQPGDFAVFMGEPKKFDPPPVKAGQEGFTVDAEEATDPESGYVQLGFSTNQGSLTSTSTNRANSFKIVNKFTYQGLSFLWHPEFLPNYGLEFDKIDGEVPLFDYYGNIKSTTLAMSRLRISYRNRLGPSKIRWKVFLHSETQDFKTDNMDEYVLTSTQTGIGLGGLVGYIFNNEIPMASTPFYGNPVGFFFEGYYVPSLSVIDGSRIQRGTGSAGSNFQGYAVWYSHVFYIDMIPWFKRYFLDIKYSGAQAQIKMQGPTKNPASNFYAIPENGSYSESENVFSITFGLRFEDWAGRSLKPRSK